MDICQSVMSSFFLRAASGAYDIEQPEQLLKLLVRLARNKLASQARRERAGRRDNRRVQAAGDEGQEFVAADPSPSEQASAKELLDEAQRRLSAEERRLAELRGEGLEWAEIAARLGGNAAALRKQFSRALDRVAQELGIEEAEPG
jgi:RNA polymerase sigma factor (sigma-70 family)